MQAATQVQQPSKQQHMKRARHAHGGPICCKQEMYEMVRRAILRSNGSVVYCSVWQCLNCGRLLL